MPNNNQPKKEQKKKPDPPSENFVVNKQVKLKSTSHVEENKEGFDRMVDHFKMLPFQHHHIP
jgi:hypothetical protein